MKRGTKIAGGVKTALFEKHSRVQGRNKGVFRGPGAKKLKVRTLAHS